MCSEWENMRIYTVRLCVNVFVRCKLVDCMQCTCECEWCVCVCVCVPNVFESNEHFQSMHKHSTTIKQSSELLVRVDHPLASISFFFRTHKWKVEFCNTNARTHLFIFVCLLHITHRLHSKTVTQRPSRLKSYEHHQWNPNTIPYHWVQLYPTTRKRN